MDKSQVLRTVKDIDVKGKKVLVRLDLDVPLVKSEIRNPCLAGRQAKSEIEDDTRLVNTLATIKYLLDRQAKVTIIGHLGRPLKNSKLKIPASACHSPSGSIRTRLMVRSSADRQNSKFSLMPVRKWYAERLTGYKNWELWENLRFDLGEEANSQSFAEDIVRRSGAEIYVFEAFATAHEPHASVISVPKMVAETAVGFRFAEEIRNLSKIWQNPNHPVVFVLGGAKLDTKLALVEKLTMVADTLLLGGLFPTQVQSSKFKVQSYSSKLKVAELRGDGLDITEESARMFADKIMAAGTVVWNGPMGLFEKPINALTHQRINALDVCGTSAWGTWVVAKAMRETGAFTVAGGGDTEAALTKLGGSKGIDWISSGGGAMLYYLAHHTLPFLEAMGDNL